MWDWLACTVVSVFELFRLLSRLFAVCTLFYSIIALVLATLVPVPKSENDELLRNVLLPLLKMLWVALRSAVCDSDYLHSLFSRSLVVDSNFLFFNSNVLILVLSYEITSLSLIISTLSFWFILYTYCYSVLISAVPCCIFFVCSLKFELLICNCLFWCFNLATSSADSYALCPYFFRLAMLLSNADWRDMIWSFCCWIIWSLSSLIKSSESGGSWYTDFASKFFAALPGVSPVRSVCGF